MDEEEDDSTFPAQQCRPPSACTRSANGLLQSWVPHGQLPRMQNVTCLMAGGSHQPAHQSSFCMTVMTCCWSSPLQASIQPSAALSSRCKGWVSWGCPNPRLWSLQCFITFTLTEGRSASSCISLPSEIDRLTASILRVYKYAAQSVCSLDADTLLSVYQALVSWTRGSQSQP